MNSKLINQIGQLSTHGAVGIERAKTLPQEEPIATLKTKNLCWKCIGESYLSDQVKAHGARGKCSYCEKVRRGYNLVRISKEIEGAFEQHYVRAVAQPSAMQYAMMMDKESRYEWDPDGELSDVSIMNAADIPKAAAADLQKILAQSHYDFDAAKCGEESEFSSGVHYELKEVNDAEWRAEWRTFEQSIRTEARFFSRSATALLDSIFEGIETLLTHDNLPVVVEGGPGTTFSSIYRARCFQSEEELEEALKQPELHLGPPPSPLARPGRMNADGISVFYGANDPSAALAEVRPPVGSRVAIAHFEIVRPVRLLDLKALNAIGCNGSIFDPGYARRLERAAFLRHLGRLLALPVLPNQERFEYLPTQAIADYLATRAPSPLDGIVFPSVQVAGGTLNIVLFHGASRVEKVHLPEGTEVSVSCGSYSEDGWEQCYTVWEETPGKTVNAVKPEIEIYTDPLLFFDERGQEDQVFHNPTLRIDLDSIEIRHVESVNFHAPPHPVERYRSEMRHREIIGAMATLDDF